MALANQVMINHSNLAEIHANEANTFRVLQETLYPGSTDQEVSMILGYCKARRIDPILKPVHLVPMSVKTDKVDSTGKSIYERKNVIMPGIGLYRIDASRSGQYAGVDEPEFGEDVTDSFSTKNKDGKVTSSIKVTYPKWCKITVRKLLPNGEVALFTAKEYWKENYASKSKWDDTPNDMWQKRAYGQLAKCAEAQALRKAFPDVVGNEYTMEEMQGKMHDHRESRTFTNEESTTATGDSAKSTFKSAEDTKIHVIEEDLMDISWAETIDGLKEIYTVAYKYWMKKKNKENLDKLIEAKDKKMAAIESEENINPETGEIKE